MNQGEYEALMSDPTKRIDRDLDWAVDDSHPAALSFRTDISSEAGYPLYVKGYLNQNSRKLTYVLLHRAEGCVYRLDLGMEHPNLDGTRVGEKHKHAWTPELGIKDAYVPKDITATLDEPVKVWEQFCTEAKVVHSGQMGEPPAEQMDMML
jgi:hypothetical protein